ncbi:MAG: 2-succinyl-5-enolpyruvyl-6-hydroxy-3-cyclohexene-1-carboxylic-acid synthase [Actinomycetes bacterium]
MSDSATAPLDQAEGIAVLCGRLADLGVRFAAISPGSRSAPLALALVRCERIQCVPVIDERSAAFVALGAAKGSGQPALVVTTSGTAAANLAPAIHEAREARVPLIALTADRPPELRGVGEGQTIDQVRLFGSAAGFFDLENGGTEADWASLADEAVAVALATRPGPAQINLALRPPLETVAAALPPGAPQADDDRRAALDRTASEDLPALLSGSRRPLVIAGRDERGGGSRLAAECARLGLPVLADPLSGAFGGATGIALWDPILRCRDWSVARLPDLVIRTGDMPTSKPLRAWLENARSEGAAVIQFDPELARRDPTFSTTHRSESDPVASLSPLSPPTPESGWLGSWLEASNEASEALEPLVGSTEGALSEPAVATGLARSLDSAEVLFVSASMPIRDVESLVPWAPGSPRVLSNRGANGIDGVISTAAGVALASGTRTAVLIGDVAFCHDQGVMTTLRDAEPAVCVVVVDNGVGSIFDILPIASQGDPAFEPFFATPTQLPLEDLCGAWEVPYKLIESPAELEQALAGRPAGPSVLHVRVPREQGHRLRRAAWEAVSERLEPSSP